MPSRAPNTTRPATGEKPEARTGAEEQAAMEARSDLNRKENQEGIN
jgi:hypothetical protein